MNPHGFFLLAILLLTPGLCVAASDQWIQVSSEHFTVVTNSNEKEGRQLVDELERMRWTFSRIFPKMGVDSEDPIVVIAAKNGKSFEALEPKSAIGEGKLKLSGLFIRGMDNSFVLLRLGAEQEHPYSNIYHEYTHFQFRKIEMWLPVWLNEGLAQFMQNTVIHNKDVELGQPDVNALFFLRQNSLIPLRILLRVDHNSPYYHEENKGNIFYAESWALTHMLMVQDNEQKTHKVVDYMIRISRHEDAAAAAEAVFGKLETLEGQLASYIHGGNFKEFVLNTVSAPLDESSYKNKVLSAAESDAIRADFMAHVGRTDEARAMLEGVLKSDPECVKGYEALAGLELRSGNQTAAVRLYGEAVKRGANDAMLLNRYANLLLAQGRSDQNVRNAEVALRKMIQLNPKNAQAYDRLSELLRMNPQTMEEARKLELQAIDIDQGNVRYRLVVAGILLTENKLDESRAVLVAAQKIASNTTDSANVDARIKQIDSILKASEDANAMMQTEDASATADTIGPVVATGAPKHPDEPAATPKHTIDGVIRGVTCSYPAQMDLRVSGMKKEFKLYSNNYKKIDFSVIGFKPTDKLDPCSTMEGLRAHVVYAESSDKTVDGQVISILLKK